MKRYLVLILIIMWTACDFPSQSTGGDSIEIRNIFWEYNQLTNEVFVQVELDAEESAQAVDSIVVSLKEPSNSNIIQSFVLNDLGINGDQLVANDVFSLLIVPDESLQFGIYKLITEVYQDSRITLDEIMTIAIEEMVAPEIINVDFPSTFSIDDTEWKNLEISVTIDEPNGYDDIKYVRYEINTELLTIDCEGNINPDPDIDLYQSSPTWQMDYSYTNNDGFHVYSTSIPMRPVHDDQGGCGKTGTALFRFLVKDNTNLSDMVSEQDLFIVACTDGECQDDAETSDTCPEDCPE